MFDASHPLLSGLVDDAALFPPGNAPMPEALARHAQHRGSAYSAAVGPFLCPASRVAELVATLAGGQHLALSLVVDVTGDEAHRALRAVAADARLRLVGVEGRLAQLGADAAAVGANLTRRPGAVGSLEVTAGDVEAGLEVVATTGWHRAKYRTGGLGAQAFPSEVALASFVTACVTRDLPFKLTAGLHHAVRSTAPDGVEQHGVLNVLAAVRAAQTGVSGVAPVLAERDGDRLADEVLRWTATEASAVRRLFTSFGCCGVTEPLTDLADLGVLAVRP